jgi:hypothetical protein
MLMSRFFVLVYFSTDGSPGFDSSELISELHVIFTLLISKERIAGIPHHRR